MMLTQQAGMEGRAAGTGLAPDLRAKTESCGPVTHSRTDMVDQVMGLFAKASFVTKVRPDWLVCTGSSTSAACAIAPILTTTGTTPWT